MRESKLNYTQEELLELKKLAEDILKNIDNMELEDIKRQYLHMSNEPLFHVDYRVHPTEHINNLRGEEKILYHILNLDLIC